MAGIIPKKSRALVDTRKLGAAVVSVGALLGFDAAAAHAGARLYCGPGYAEHNPGCNTSESYRSFYYKLSDNEIFAVSSDGSTELVCVQDWIKTIGYQSPICRVGSTYDPTGTRHYKFPKCWNGAVSSVDIQCTASAASI
jgi:hypothetical protein